MNAHRLVLQQHPFASFCWKALIALYRARAAVRNASVDDAAARRELARLRRLGRILALRDETLDLTLPDSSTIIEYLDDLAPAGRHLTPQDHALAQQARLWHGVADDYVATPKQAIVGDRLHSEDVARQYRVDQARDTLDRAYDLLDGQLASHDWLAGPGFTIADCGAAPARRLSLDEAHHRRGRELATVVSDLDRRRVVEVLDGRSRRRVERYLGALPEPDRDAIEVVSIDPYEAYRQAIRAVLPGARIVVDHFHLVRGANTALDSVRRERQREAGRRRPKGTRRSGQQARWRPELYRARHRLLKATERLSERERRRLCELFEHEPLSAEAWGLKEAFRSIYKAPYRGEAERRLDRFLAAVDRAQLPAFAAFAEGVRLWREELLAYFDEPTTNGYAEGVINKVKVIKRRAYGLPTFDGFRERVLLACA